MKLLKSWGKRKPWSITLCDCIHTGVELSAASNGVDSLDIEGTEDGSESGKGKEFHLDKVNGMGWV
jgi:hypothetical protein